jgi:hypothetical protein
MKITKTLGWFQKHATDSSIRANIQTTVTNDDDSQVASSGEDVTITDPTVVSLAAQLEKAVLAFTSSTLPAPQASAAAAE